MPGSSSAHFQSGIAHVESGISPGTILRTHVMEHDVFNAGLDEFDFLDGTEAYKFQWATGIRRLFDITLRPRTPTGRAGALMGGLREVHKFEIKRRRSLDGADPT